MNFSLKNELVRDSREPLRHYRLTGLERGHSRAVERGIALGVYLRRLNNELGLDMLLTFGGPRLVRVIWRLRKLVVVGLAYVFVFVCSPVAAGAAYVFFTRVALYYGLLEAAFFFWTWIIHVVEHGV